MKARFKKRHLKQLPVEVRENIVKMYLEDHVYQKDIAKRYRISAALVSKLVKEAQEESTRNDDLRKKEAKEREEVNAIKQNVKEMLDKDIPITNADTVVKRVRISNGMEVTADKVKNIMKDELGLKYRIAKRIPTQANS